MAKEYKDCLSEMETDVAYFLEMCTKSDKKIFLSDPKKKKTEDFGRFICLGGAFNMRGVFLNMFAQHEYAGDIDDILNYLDGVTYELLEKWVEDFLKTIGEPILKKCAQSIWEEKKKYFSEHGFKISKLL